MTMKNAIIYMFSGTGNTKRACDIYKQEFEKNGVNTTIFTLKKGFENLPNPNEFDCVGFAYPVHGFNAPAIMLDLAKALPSTDKKEYFVLKTSGEPLEINNVSSIKMNSILKKKGYVAGSEYHYVMPYNMIFRHSDEMSVKMLDTLNNLAPIEAKEVLDGKVHKLSKVPLGALWAWIVRIEQPAMKMNGKHFKVDSQKCIKCGACARNCPVGNIRIDENGKFSFGGDCLMCTRCSFNCPTDAFDIGLLNGWRVNGKYSFKTPKTPQKDKHSWYCKRAYKRYFENAKRKIEQYKTSIAKNLENSNDCVVQ